MKIFCSYAFTGEDLTVVTSRMKRVVSTLNSRRHEAYCNLFDPIVDEMQKRDDIRAIFARAFEEIGRNEAIVAVITSPTKSVGQIMEFGVALSHGKPIYLLEHSSVKDSTYLPRLATKTYKWTTEAELLNTLKEI